MRRLEEYERNSSGKSHLTLVNSPTKTSRSITAVSLTLLSIIATADLRSLSHWTPFMLKQNNFSLSHVTVTFK